jgi:protein phosphatase
MGGHAGGDTASRLAVEGACAGFARPGALSERLLAAIEQAHVAVWHEAERDPKLMGMGTTMVCLAISDDQFQVAHVGDSRAYLVSGDSIQQLTTDHSWVGEQVAIGKMTEDEAAKHPFRGAITRCLGCQPTVDPDVQPAQSLEPAMSLVLCSDGLTNHVLDDEIRSIVVSRPASDAVMELVRLANERGGIDNITVVIAQADGVQTASHD